MNIIYAILLLKIKAMTVQAYIYVYIYIYIESGASGISVRTVRQGIKKIKERER